jgi:hypothetical protein
MTISKITNRPVGERRWLALGEDGRDVWLGRYSDHSPEEVAAVEASLMAQGLAAWLAVMEGDYWRRRSGLVLIEVQPLGAPGRAFVDAVLALQTLRAVALPRARQTA